MRIKLYILESDASYLERITSVFSNKYAADLEIRSFTNPELALNGLANDRVDVFLASDEFEIDPKTIPNRTAFAYFTDSSAVEEIRGQTVISRFQKADLIYKEILSLYSENSNVIIGLNDAEGVALQLAFTSTSGGTGTSTLAAGAAMRFAGLGKRVLYFDIDTLADASVFFNGQGASDFGDLIYAIKRQKSNLGLKVESIVRQDPTGVYYFEPTRNSLDNLSLSDSEILRLINLFATMGSFDVIILDIPFSLEKETFKYLENCRKIVCVLDGLEVANRKFLRALDSITVLEDRKGIVFTPKLEVAYNKFGSRVGKRVEANVRTLGGVSRFESPSAREIVEAISKQAFLDKLLQD